MEDLTIYLDLSSKPPPPYVHGSFLKTTNNNNFSHQSQIYFINLQEKFTHKFPIFPTLSLLDHWSQFFQDHNITSEENYHFIRFYDNEVNPNIRPTPMMKGITIHYYGDYCTIATNCLPIDGFFIETYIDNKKYLKIHFKAFRNSKTKFPHSQAYITFAKLITTCQKRRITGELCNFLKKESLTRNGYLGYQKRSLPMGSMKEVVDNLKGFTYVDLINKPETNGGKEYYPNGECIQTITHFLPNIVEALQLAIDEDSCYFQLDSSFRILSPYVFSLLVWVRGQVGIILGYVFGPQENCDLYSTLWENLRKIFTLNSGKINWNDFIKKVMILSDEGTSLISFFTKYCIKYCLCHVHLLRSFGLKNDFIKFLKQLLGIRTEEEFIEKKQSIIDSLIDELNLKQRSLQSLKIRKIEKILAIRIKYVSEESSFHYEADYSQKFPISCWALWERGKLPPWTQIIEGIHMNLRTHLETSYYPTQSLIKRFYYFNVNIEEMALNYTERCQNAVKRRLETMFKSSQNNKDINYDPGCKCPQSILFNQMFGIELCVHRVKNQSLNELKEKLPTFGVPEGIKPFLSLYILEESSSNITVETSSKPKWILVNKESRKVCNIDPELLKTINSIEGFGQKEINEAIQILDN